MPKFKPNTSKAMKKGPYKMKYKHSAFPFKSSPVKQTGPSGMGMDGDNDATDFTSKYSWRDSEEMDRMTRGAFSAQREARKKQYELDNPVDTATSAIEDLDKRVTNLGG